MIIVSGTLSVDAADRDEYVAICRVVVEQARAAAGCLDFVITADPLEADRVNIYERWETDADVERFRTGGPETPPMPPVVDAEVFKYRISATEAP